MNEISCHLPLQEVSRETTKTLEIYVELLTKWNATINLVSAQSLTDVWSRHISDSGQLLTWVDGPKRRWGDFGAGGGLPGMVVAILARDAGLSIDMVLVESDRRKCAFLQTVKQTLSLDVTIIAERAEDCPPLACDIVSARALAPLARLLPYAIRHLKPDGKALFLKGKSYEDEIAEARKSWSFTVICHPSMTDPASVVLELSQISHAG